MALVAAACAPPTRAHGLDPLHDWHADSTRHQMGAVNGAGDIDADGSLSVIHFVTFQLLWQDGDPSADCVADGEFNVLDFVCFQLLFQAGCD